MSLLESTITQYTIQHDVKVRSFGKVHCDSTLAFEMHLRAVWCLGPTRINPSSSNTLQKHNVLPIEQPLGANNLAASDARAATSRRQLTGREQSSPSVPMTDSRKSNAQLTGRNTAELDGALAVLMSRGFSREQAREHLMIVALKRQGHSHEQAIRYVRTKAIARPASQIGALKSDDSDDDDSDEDTEEEE